MDGYQLEINRQELTWLISGYWEFPDPRQILTGLTGTEACAWMGGLPYTIAQLTGHMHWWQQRRLQVALGEDPGEFVPQRDDWPEVEADQWADLVESFLASNDELMALAAKPAVLGRQVFGNRSVASMLVSHATHNAYHLGQVVLIRRLLGKWER